MRLNICHTTPTFRPGSFRLICLALFLFAVSISGCNSGETEKQSTNEEPAPLVELFEADLAKLDKTALQSLDKATNLFKGYQSKIENQEKGDLLFQPYFNFYNSGRNILVAKSDSLVAAYGFSRKVNDAKEFIVPTYNAYWKINILPYLSSAMKDFTTQQLIEFDDPGTLESRAKYAIWWEQFNRGNPDFFMAGMSQYHYTYWHVNKLLNGTRRANVFNGKGVLIAKAKSVYQSVIDEYPESGTAGILKEYLALLEQTKGKKTAEVEDFLKQYKSE
ncbi:MAG: hypothetical protein ACRBF0_13565 [Calditrichia bacterium]